MTDSPLDTHNSHYRLQLAVQRSHTTIEQLDRGINANGYLVTSTTRNQALSEYAHKELLAAITDCLPYLDTYQGMGRPLNPLSRTTLCHCRLRNPHVPISIRALPTGTHT
jgi:hypothetical protein